MYGQSRSITPTTHVKARNIRRRFRCHVELVPVLIMVLDRQDSYALHDDGMDKFLRLEGGQEW